MIVFNLFQYTEFRGPGEWEGEYDDVGKVVAKLNVGQDLQYHLVISKQPDEVDGDYVDVFFLIPVTWIDWEGKRFLYPGPDYQVHGLPPWEWRDLSYRRRRHPEPSWVEYDIAEFINESPGKILIFFIFECFSRVNSKET